MAYAGTAADGEHLKRHLHVKFCCSAKHISIESRSDCTGIAGSNGQYSTLTTTWTMPFARENFLDSGSR